MYALLFKTFFARMDPEAAHGLAFRWIRIAARIPGFNGILARALGPKPGAEVETMGLRFPAPFGLAAGFDKKAVGVRGLSMLGFSHIEIGTVTALAQPGNDKPRLERLIPQRALINRMGFNNPGAAAVAENLRALRERADGADYLVGVNIGKTKVVAEADAVRDYVDSVALLAPFADYLVVNVSSPNTPGLRNLQAVEVLGPLLETVRSTADAVAGRHVPLLVKIAPDLANDDVDAIARMIVDIDLDGVVAVNTTIAHDHGQGGMSGPPLLPRGVEVVARLREQIGQERTIIGVGGISGPRDAAKYLDAGANLIQGYTAFIYEGPFWASRINRQLARRPRQ